MRQSLPDDWIRRHWALEPAFEAEGDGDGEQEI